MYGVGGIKVREPKDPPLITRFMDKVKRDSTYKLSSSDRRKEKAIFAAKKKFMSSNNGSLKNLSCY